MGFFSRLFGRPDAPTDSLQMSYRAEDWTIERVRRQGINPLVRNADDDYYAVATNYAAANRLARDCGHTAGN